jgi:hypothetical protein
VCQPDKAWYVLALALVSCHPTTDPKLTASELSCVAEAGTRAAADACRQRVRAAWAASHDASALVDGGFHGGD